MPPATDDSLSLFDDAPAPPAPKQTVPPVASTQAATRPLRSKAVEPALPLLGTADNLAAQTPILLRMGGSSWSYPGWHGTV